MWSWEFWYESLWRLFCRKHCKAWTIRSWNQSFYCETKYAWNLIVTSKKNEPPSYYSTFKRALVENKYPISEPPWGTITAINLNNGKKIWQVPFGEYEELKSLGIERTGTENFGGVTGTEGNLIFATGTLDKKFYVFNSTTGDELFSYEMPYIGSAPPTTYQINGKQYIIVHATGGKSLMQGYPNIVQNGNMLVAFSIKD